MLRSTASRAAERRPSVMGGRARLRGLSGPGRHHHCTASRIRSTHRNDKALWDPAGRLCRPFAGWARSHNSGSVAPRGGESGERQVGKLAVEFGDAAFQDLGGFDLIAQRQV